MVKMLVDTFVLTVCIFLLRTMVKLYIVFGVDTAVGAAVAHHLSKRSKVKGIPLGHPKTKGEVDDPPGVEIARCDPSNSRSLEHILKDCDGCFIYTLTDFVNNPSSFMANELSYGRSIAEACKQAHVPHTIYCTEPHTTDILGVGARHMIAKAETEQCICVKDIPLTLLILPRLYEDLLSYLAPEQVEDHFVFGKGLHTIIFSLWLSVDIQDKTITQDNIYTVM